MGFRFRKSFKVMPGVRLTLSPRGISSSFGIPGARITIGRRGITGTVGIPGTGLSYSHKLTGTSKGSRSRSASNPTYWAPPAVPAQSIPAQVPKGIQIASAPIGQLTSPNLQQLRQMIIDADRQRQEIRAEVASVRKAMQAVEKKLKWLDLPVINAVLNKRREALRAEATELRESVNELNEWMRDSLVEAEFILPPSVSQSFQLVMVAFEKLKYSHAIWDVTYSENIDRSVARSAASSQVRRYLVKAETSESESLVYAGKSLRLQNQNGEDIQFYPGVLLMESSKKEFALIDYLTINVDFGTTRFVEDERVPNDTKVVGSTWYKVNKDGSPDRRFAQNFEIPIVEYGFLRFTSPLGLYEEFLVSNAQLALEFGQALRNYQSAQRHLSP